MKRGILVFLLALLLAMPVLAQEYRAGDTIIFGRYEQDNDLSNGPEPIAWRVLSVEGDRALLISRYCLDAQPYNRIAGQASWVNSSLRAWLNFSFYPTAFTEEEQDLVLATTMKNWHEYETTDRVFLLDNWQAKELFADHPDRMAKPTAYTEAQWAYISKDYGPGNVHWWLRTISWESGNMASFVAASGGVMTCGGETLGKIEYPRITVRPCITLDLTRFTPDPTLVAYERTPKALITHDVLVNVRSEPNANSAKVGTVTPTRTYPLLGVADNGWAQIQLPDGAVGYISPKMYRRVDY